MQHVYNREPFKRGFSLIEMLVVVAIMLIITMVILFDLPRMGGSTSIDLIAQEVAINIRGAQVYSGATKVEKGGTTFTSFGVHFNSLPNCAGNKFLLFADNAAIGANKKYDLGEEQESYLLPAGFCIESLKQPNGNAVTSLDIFYEKPDPEAVFTCGAASCLGEFVEVIVRSKRVTGSNATRMVRVYANGQIEVAKN